jgi:hypothetical protein
MRSAPAADDSCVMTASQVDQRAQTRLGLRAVLIPLFFAVGFAACIIGSYHKPHPNGIEVGVVGPSEATAPLVARMQQGAGSAFDISQVATVAEAQHDVSERDLDAAFVPTANPKQPATVIVASANGRIVATAAETLARNVTAAQGAQLDVDEVRPLASGDEIGLGVFLFLVVCTICGYLTPTVLETLAPALAPNRRYPIIAATSLMVPTLVVLIGGLAYDTYTGSFGTILAFIGVGALYVFTIGLGTRLFQVLLGPAGIFASLAILVFLNIASLGATYTPPVLAPFWQFLNHFWIGAAAVDAERSILYFGGSGAGGDILIVLAWIAAIAALLLLPASRKLELKREHPVAAEVAA